MQPLLLLLAFLLPPRAGTDEIIGGHEARPHSRPYMAYLQIWHQGTRKRCGGSLVREDFVLTAAHCWGSSINVTLGAHNIKKQEKTQQVIRVKRATAHPAYSSNRFSNDIMLLQLETKARRTAAVRPLKLPRFMSRGDSGGPLVCKNVTQGILSSGRINGTPPGIFMNVSHFLPWIRKTMKRSHQQQAKD
ncbi:granzyme H-like isoform X2 [Eulemur rufifrons]|uniref:granzyme H-like isoform X2 n=1 Tax=Eulemur rufifrons TaxID=859984 RepID=UPI00374446F4